MDEARRRARIVVMAAGAVVIVIAAALVQAGHRHSPNATRVAAVAPGPTSPSTAARPASTARRAASTTTVTHAPRTNPTTTRATAPPTTARTTPRTAPPVAPVAVGVAGTGGDHVPGLGAVRGKTIVIDAGHNGGNGAHAAEISRPIFIGTQTRACDTTGTETNGGYTEAAYNLDVALRLQSILSSAGAHVVMVRTSNDGWGPCIDQRAAIGNQAHADAAISIHADGGPASGRGFHVLTPANIAGYTDDIYDASKRLGVAMRDAFSAVMPVSNYIGGGYGIVARTDLGGLNLSNVPKVFVETGNMRNSTDASLLTSSDWRERAARALADGLAAYLRG